MLGCQSERKTTIAVIDPFHNLWAFRLSNNKYQAD
jgi:hypothetical protein